MRPASPWHAQAPESGMNVRGFSRCSSIWAAARGLVGDTGVAQRASAGISALHLLDAPHGLPRKTAPRNCSSETATAICRSRISQDRETGLKWQNLSSISAAKGHCVGHRSWVQFGAFDKPSSQCHQGKIDSPPFQTFRAKMFCSQTDVSVLTAVSDGSSGSGMTPPVVHSLRRPTLLFCLPGAVSSSQFERWAPPSRSKILANES